MVEVHGVSAVGKEKHEYTCLCCFILSGWNPFSFDQAAASHHYPQYLSTLSRTLISFCRTTFYSCIHLGGEGHQESIAQEYNIMSRLGLEPRPLDPESSALTMKLPRLPEKVWNAYKFECHPCAGAMVIFSVSLKLKLKILYLPSAVFIARRLVGTSKQLKQIIQI